MQLQKETCFLTVGKSAWEKETAVQILPGSGQGFEDSFTLLAVAEALISIFPICSKTSVSFDI